MKQIGEGKTAYIAGKITGDPAYRIKFNAAALELEESGYTVMNPAILPDGFTWGSYMHICQAMLAECDCMFLLSDWEDSKGAKIECTLATLHKKTIYAYADFLSAKYPPPSAAKEA